MTDYLPPEAPFGDDKTTAPSTSTAVPHSREAEEAVVGAVFINSEVYYDIAQFLNADDFYIHRHRWIWEAFTSLHEQRIPVDLLTVSDELDRRGQLNELGGPAYLTSLVNQVPSSLNAESYGRIVEGYSIRRKMINAANQIASIAYNERTSVNDVMDEAEKAVFNVSERRLKHDLLPIKSVLSEYYDRIDDLAKRPDDVHGVPTGFIDLDKMLTGLQPSDLLIIAGRPGQGKTGFLLSIAKNAGLTHKKHVAIFSLEMSNEQVVQRLIAQETGIDSQRLRTGRLHENEWPLFTHSIEVFGDTHIYLDDTPAITPLQLRTKCRRLHMEFGLDLIIIDYLQLMGGDTRNDNRVQEVSYISRNLKILARELNVPVLAAAQLSRAVEQRSDKRPVLSDLRESGCLSGDTLVTLENGRNVPIRELEGSSNFKVWALNPAMLKLEAMSVSRAFCTGVKPVFKMTTRLGRKIRATANHQFLTIYGWKRLDQLQTGEYIAMPRIYPAKTQQQTMSDAELALLGHLIGDGCTLPRHVIQYTTREKDLANIVANLAVEVFGKEVNPRISPERQWYQVYLSSTRHHTHNIRSAVTEWLEELQAFGLRSYEKRIPAQVFEQPEHAISVFLRHLWATDGSILLVKGKKTRPIAYYATSSRQLAYDVQSLLLQLGINAILKQVSQTNGKGRDQYHITITGKADLEIFVNKIGAVGEYKQERLAEVQAYLEEREANTNRDVIPNNVWRLHVVPAMQQMSITTRQMQAAIGTEYCGTGLYKQNLSRERAARVGNIVQSSELQLLAKSDIYWDSINLIEPDGEEQVYDLTVPDHHNFVANNIIVHNSLEQDADIVMFIYRPDQYEKDTVKQNVAEIIIAKHRNGPVGSVELVFRSALAKFENAATKIFRPNE